MRKESIVIESFTGVNRGQDPTKIADSEFHTFENAELKRYGDIGAIVKRFGYERLNSNVVGGTTPQVVSIHEHIANGTPYLLVKSDSASSRIDYTTGYTSGGWTNISSESTGRLNFTSFKNNCYVCNRNGSDNKVWLPSGNSYKPHGCPPPWSASMTATGQTVTGGTVPNGAHLYAVTFLYDNGQESGSIWYKSGSVNTGAGENSIRLTGIPVGVTGYGVVGRRLYRMHTSSGVFRLLEEIRNNTQTTFDDVKAEADLISVMTDNDELFITNLKKPKISKYQCVHKGRLWQGNITDNYLNPLSSGGITITPQNHASGALANGTYTYRIHKSFMANDIDGYPGGFQIVLSQGVEITPTALAGANDSYNISFNSTIQNDEWFKYVAIYRKNPGSTEFKLLTLASADEWHLPTNVAYDDISATSNYVVKPIFPETSVTSFPSNVTYSDPENPDLFPTGNEIQLGDNDGEAIKGMFSETNGLVAFKEKSIWKIYTDEPNPNYWSADKVVPNIGADEAVQLPDGRYFFYSSKTSPQQGITFYMWNGSSKPEIISQKIQPLIEGANYSVKGMAYDTQRNRVYVTVWNNATATMKVVIYDLDFGTWFIHLNATSDLALRATGVSKEYGVIFGDSVGYVQYNRNPVYQDKIGASATATNFRSKIRTKTFTVPRGYWYIRRIFAVVGSASGGSSNAFDIKHMVDGYSSGSPTSNTFTLATNLNNLQKGLRSAEGTEFYLQIENSDNADFAIHKVGVDMRIKHEKRRG